MALRDYRRSLVKRRQRKGHRTFAHRRRDLIWVPGGNLTGQNHQVAACDRPRNTEGSRASPQDYRQLRAHPWILEPSATGLCEPDLHVFAKLFEDRLERGLEAQAFSGREIGGDDDVLDFFVGHLVDVDLTRQPAA